MDYIKMQQQELAARKARRKKAAQRNKFTKLPIKTQLINGIKAGKLPKETPQEYVDRLWQIRKNLKLTMESSRGYFSIEKLHNRIADIETKVAEIVNTRKLKHPGV